MVMSMRYTGKEKNMLCKIIVRLSQNVIIVLALLVLCACGKSEPDVYDEKKSYGYDLYYLEMNEEGQFAIEDMLCRSGGGTYVFGGEYYLYEEKLVLTSNHKDIKLTFIADGDNWVYNQEESEGIDVLKVKMEDQAIWKPSVVFHYFK